LRSLYRLAKAASGAEPAIAPLPRGEAIATLIASSLYVNADHHRDERLWASLSRLARAAPVTELSFRPDASLWSLVDAGGQAGAR
jgi:hypothetical protein